MKNKTRQIIIGAVVLLTVLCLVFIFGNSLKDSTESSEQSFAVKKLLMDVARVFGFNGDINVSNLRNLAHVGEFCLLSICLSTLSIYIARRKGKKSVLYYASFVGASVFVGLIIAIIDELIQLMSEGRACEVKDILLDMTGILIGALVSSLGYFLFIKIRLSKQKDKISKNT